MEQPPAQTGVCDQKDAGEELHGQRQEAVPEAARDKRCPYEAQNRSGYLMCSAHTGCPSGDDRQDGRMAEQ